MTTLRSALITPFPDLTVPEYLPNPDTSPKQYPGQNYVPNPDAHHEEIRREFADAAAWTALIYAQTQDYHSDSTLDTHNAMIETLNLLHMVIYGDDQTKDDATALNDYLESDWDALEMTVHPNCALPDNWEETHPLPALFARFDLNWEHFNN